MAASVLVLGVVGYVAYSLGAASTKPRKSASTATSTATKGNSDVTEKSDSENSGSQESPGDANIALSEYSNERFGFKVGYPQGWRLVQSQNGDGATATSPDKTSAVYIYGEFTTVFSLSAIADAQTDRLKSQYPDVRTVDRRQTLVDDHPVYLVVWQYTKDDSSSSINGAVRNAALITIKGETAIKIECQMPTGQYDSFKPTADAIFNSLRLK